MARQSSRPGSRSGPRPLHEANGDASARSGETKTKRLRRRRNKAAAKRYETLLKLDNYDLQKSCETDIYYIGWYDKTARQTRRRTLNTVDTKLAMAEADFHGANCFGSLFPSMSVQKADRPLGSDVNI
jgi:hypothetical protein